MRSRASIHLARATRRSEARGNCRQHCGLREVSRHTCPTMRDDERHFQIAMPHLTGHAIGAINVGSTFSPLYSNLF